MSQIDYEDDFDDDTTEAQPQERGESKDIRQLRKKADKADQLEAKVQELTQQLAVNEAGLTGLNERQRAALTRTHEGEWTPEALKATAVELNFIQEEPDVPTETVEAHQRIANASAGAPPAGGSGDAQTRLDEALKTGGIDAFMAEYRATGLPIAGE